MKIRWCSFEQIDDQQNDWRYIWDVDLLFHLFLRSVRFLQFSRSRCIPVNALLDGVSKSLTTNNRVIMPGATLLARQAGGRQMQSGERQTVWY